MTPKLIGHINRYSEELLPDEISALIGAGVIYRCQVCPALIGDSIYHPFGEHGDKTFPEIKKVIAVETEGCETCGSMLTSSGKCTVCGDKK